jgi:hypothetical protein
LITDLHLFSINPPAHYPNTPTPQHSIFITKKEFLLNRPGNDMANKLPDHIFFSTPVQNRDSG